MADRKLTSNEKTAEGRKARRRARKELCERENLREIHTPSGVLLEPFSVVDKEAYLPGYKAMCGQLDGQFIGTSMDEALDDANLLSYFNRRTGWQSGIEDGITFADPDILDREAEFSNKVGPFYQENYVNWAHKVHASYQPPILEVNDTLRDAIRSVSLEYKAQLSSFGADKATIGVPSSYLGVMEVKSSTGYPFYTSQWGVELEYQGEMISPVAWACAKADELVRSGDYALLQQSPYTLFTRKAPRGRNTNPTGGQKPTERPVQCSPILERFIAVGFQKVVMDVQRNLEFSQGLRGSKHIGKAIAKTIGEFPGCFEADYASFDTSIGEAAIRLIFDEVYKPLFSEEHHPQLEALKEFYAGARLVTPQGIMSGETSLMSGSMLTNAIGMTWGHIAWTYFRLRMIENGEGFSHVAYGYSDDLCVFTTHDISTQFTAIVAEIGLKAHATKQRYSEGENRTTSFLGDVYSPKWRGGKRPFNRVLPKLLWREHLSHGYYDDNDGGDYHISGVTIFEVEAVKVLQRLDSLGCNTGFDAIVKHYCGKWGILLGKLNRVSKDTTVTPTMEALRRLTNAGELPMGDPIIVNEESLTDEEMAELFSLAEELRPENTKDVDRLLRAALRKLRAFKKNLTKKDSIRKVDKAFPSCPYPRVLTGDSETTDLVEISKPNPLEGGGETSSTCHKITPRELMEWSNTFKDGAMILRELLVDLREMREAANESTLYESGMKTATTTSGE